MKSKSNVAAAKTARIKDSPAVVQERLVLHLRSQDGAMEYLRANHPEFFEDGTTRNLAAMIVVEMAEELVKLSKVERVSVIATTIGLMYKMGTAALKSIRDDNRNMAQICVDEYLENSVIERPVGDQGDTRPGGMDFGESSGKSDRRESFVVQRLSCGPEAPAQGRSDFRVAFSMSIQ